MKKKLLKFKDGRTAVVEGNISIVIGKEQPIEEESLDHLSDEEFKKIKPKKAHKKTPEQL